MFYFDKSLYLLAFLTSILMIGGCADGQPDDLEKDLKNFWRQTEGAFGGSVHDLIVAPNDKIFLASNNGVYSSTNNGNSWNPENDGNIMTVNCLTITSDNHLLTGSQNGIYRWAGPYTAWTKVMNIDTAIKCLFSNSNWIFAGTGGAGIFRSSDNGQNWNRTNSGLTDLRIKSITADQNNTIYVKTNFDVFRSTDQGDTWTSITSDLPYYESPMNALQSVAVNSGGDIFVANDGGIYRSTNEGGNWQHVGLSSASTVAVQENGIIYVGTEFNGIYKSSDNGTTWLHISPLNLVNVIAFNNQGHIFTGDQKTGVHRSTNNGVIWNEILDGFSSKRIYRLIATNAGDLFASVFYRGIYRSTNKGFEWASVGLPNNIYIRALASSPSGNILVGTDQYGVFRSTDNGNSWASIGLSGKNIYSLVVDDSENIYAGASTEGVFRSTNQGANWELIGLVGKNIYCLTISANGYIYSGSELGIYKSTNSGITWNKLATNRSTGAIRSIAINDSSYILAGGDYGTYGSAIYRSIAPESDSLTEVGALGIYTVIDAIVTQNNHAFAGASGVGVYYSEDNGASWRLLNSGLTNTNITTLTKVNDDIYAGTWEDGTFVGHLK